MFILVAMTWMKLLLMSIAMCEPCALSTGSLGFKKTTIYKSIVCFWGFQKLVSSCYCLVASFLFWRPQTSRLYFPVKPQLSKANIGGSEDYAVLGSRFKAAHVKTLIWWLAKKSQDVADERSNVFWIPIHSPNCFCYSVKSLPHKVKKMYMEIVPCIFSTPRTL